MSVRPLPDDFLDSLLAQDGFFASPELAEHHRKVMDRLTEARQRENRARRFVLIACVVCFAIVAAVFAGAASEIARFSSWPDWGRTVLALVVLLSPLTAILLLCLYLFRYRWDLIKARKAARDHALSEIPRQINQLRQELEELKTRARKDDRTAPGGADMAFTLTELLVVIAVLTILVSLLLPALANAKARVRIAACKNNLHQMGKGLTMYEADFRYFPGAGNDAIPTSQPPWLVRSPESWLAKITPYLATNSNIFNCPDYQPSAPNSESYGYNAGGSCQVNCSPYSLGLGLGEGFGFIGLSSVSAPADMIALGDLQLPPSLLRFVISPWHKVPIGSLDSFIPARHAGGSDMVFVDGHVEWLKRPSWIAETDQARLRWNNDHQPHPETW